MDTFSFLPFLKLHNNQMELKQTSEKSDFVKTYFWNTCGNFFFCIELSFLKSML